MLAHRNSVPVYSWEYTKQIITQWANAQSVLPIQQYICSQNHAQKVKRNSTLCCKGS